MLRTSQIASLTLALATASASAQVTVTSGFDAGATSIGANAAQAQASFLAATGGSVVVDFESALPSSLRIKGGTVTSNSGCSPSLCGFNTTAGGANFLLIPGAKTLVTMSFADGIDFFGAYFAGMQLATGTITFKDGTTQSISLPHGDMATGGMAFLGFESSKLIGSVSLYTGNDIVSADDLVFGNRVTPQVPEPSTFAMMALGVAALAGAARARRKA